MTVEYPLKIQHGSAVEFALWGVNGDNTEPRAIRVDDSTGALIGITYEHHEVHGGSHYHIDDIQDISIGDYYDIQITTPNTTKWSHFLFKLSCENETEWWLWENVAINTAGTTITPLNNNRNSTNTSNLTVAGILNTSLALANADTAVAGATEIHHGIVGSGRDGGDFNRGSEIILKQNEDYTLRVVATVAGFVNFNLEWYEHTGKY